MERKTTDKKIFVGILGATGMVGQRFVQLLDSHPYFEIAFVGASERSVGKTYDEAAPWRLTGKCPPKVARLPVLPCEPSALPANVSLVFSALDSKVAKDIESMFRESRFFVVSNASAWRMDPSTPLMIPEVNPEHLSLLGDTPNGGIITNPNCCAIPFSMALAPLHKQWGVQAVCVATYQSVSGAGYPGESAWDMVGNVHPHAGNEEEKLAIEPCKILGTATKPAQIDISARCVRVPTADGHLLSLQVKLNNSPSIGEVKECLQDWNGILPYQLPSSPRPLLELTTRRDRPSPRFDIMAGNGMAVTIGRLERCSVMGVKFFALSHNTIRGAAGAAIANAELLVHKDFIHPKST